MTWLRMTFGGLAAAWLVVGASLATAADAPALRFQASSPGEARVWQHAARERLFALMMGGREPARVPFEPRVVRRWEEPGGRVVEELTLQTLPDRRAHVWLSRPAQPKGRVGAVLATNGHGGNGEQVVRGSGIYWYGRALAEMGYVVIAPDVGQHELQHANWSLMGERTWDALRCLDYLVALPEVDPARLAVAGLSLGGETSMYVAALDERIQIACCSGWLTTVSNMLNGHCPCFNFPGLEANFDFPDIYACVAPRRLICELGEQERAPGGFPVAIGRQAFSRIQPAYRVFNAVSNLALTVHSGPHVFSGADFFAALRETLGQAGAPLPDAAHVVAWSHFVGGPETFEGSAYYWLGRTDLQVTFDVRPTPGAALELAWGAKADVRDAALRINGREVPVRTGGHWGFRWVRVPIPEDVTGDRYEVELRRAQGLPAFLSEVRLTTPGGPPAVAPLSQQSFKASLAEKPLATLQAFPEMRPTWDRESPSPPWMAGTPDRQALFRQAERNARQANEAFFRCRRYVDGWLAHADRVTGLIPRNLSDAGNFWNGRDSAADNYPFMVLTASMTDPALVTGRLLDMLRTEIRLTSRLDRLPDDFAFAKQGWRRQKLDLDEVIFDGAEYAKDGLLPLAEWMGPSPWTERMTGITDDIWKHAAVPTSAGLIPTRNLEVCGDLLQATTRLCWFTGDAKYLDWATRLGDYFLLGTNHPTRDLAQLRLIDHGCEVVNGLTELYVVVAQKRPAKREAYRTPMHAMFDCILDKGRNADGLLYTWFNPRTGEHSKDLCDTWGYDLDGFYTMWLVDGTVSYRDAVRQALGNLHGKYAGACWADTSADGFADSIEGALNLFNREPVSSVADWMDGQIQMMWAIQKADGVVEGWHGDGNFARTSLMYALWKTQGATIQPWRSDVRFGATQQGDTVWFSFVTEQAWEGRLALDRPRHRLVMHLPLDYPRINQFPEWFTVESAERYLVAVDDGREQAVKGAELIAGLPLKLGAGSAHTLAIRHERQK